MENGLFWRVVRPCVTAKPLSALAPRQRALGWPSPAAGTVVLAAAKTVILDSRSRRKWNVGSNPPVAFLRIPAAIGTCSLDPARVPNRHALDDGSV